MPTELHCEELMQWKALLPKGKLYSTTDVDGEFAPRTFCPSERGINGDGWSISHNRFVSLEWIIVHEDER
jgi:hypothetical protein